MLPIGFQEHLGTPILRVCSKFLGGPRDPHWFQAVVRLSGAPKGLVPGRALQAPRGVRGRRVRAPAKGGLGLVRMSRLAGAGWGWGWLGEARAGS